MNFLTKAKLLRGAKTQPILVRSTGMMVERLDSEMLGTFIHEASGAAHEAVGERALAPADVDRMATFIVNAALTMLFVEKKPSKDQLCDAARRAGLEAVRG